MIATKRFTIDSNVLIYSADKSGADKHQTATRIVHALATRKRPLPLQCLNEFYRATTRERKRILDPSDAAVIVRDLLPAFQIVETEATDLVEAMDLHQHHNVPFFDALLIATVTRAGCTIFLSEDLQDGQAFGPLTIRNPFKMTEAELTTLLA